jgi:hypothetical protein
MSVFRYLELFRSRIILLCRRKKIPFFSCLLPLLLMGIVNLTFTSIPNENNSEIIKIAIVTPYTDKLPDFLTDNITFRVTYGEREKLDNQLQQKQIDGYLVFSKVIELHVNEKGRKQAAIKGYLDSSLQSKSLKSSIIEVNKQSDMKTANKNNKIDFVNDLTGTVMVQDNKYLSFLYITAFFCIMGARWGFSELTELMADISHVGKRLRLSPISSGRLIVVHLAAAYIVHTVCIMVFSFFIIQTWHNKFNVKPELFMTVVAMGSLAGILTGALVGTIRILNLKLKDVILNIMLLFMLIGAFCVPGVLRFLISQELPYLKIINPPALITEMLYTLASRNGIYLFIQDAILLSVYILSVGIWLFIRFRKYNR